MWRKRGITITEAVAAVSVMIPIMASSAMAISELSHAYVIKEGLQQCAREAALGMTAVYQETHIVDGNRAAQDSLVYNSCRLNNIVNSSAQFDNAVFDQTSSPPTVTVNVRYTSGQYGLPPFPLYAPLNLGSNFEVNAQATYALY